jgi:AcrR family transcriptional regulator/DNA-binding MarR family transcriptional regulator
MSSRSRQPVGRSAVDVGRSRSRLDGFERERVTDVQRARLLAAAGQVACERGAANMTVSYVVERAGVSRRTFYEIFADAEQCLLATLDQALARAAERVLPAWRSLGDWRERVRGCLVELLCLFDEEPQLARLLIVESLSAGPSALKRRARVLGELIAALDEGRADARAGMDPTPLSAEGVVGGVLAVIHARVLDARPGPLLALTNQLMSTIVLPYQGAAAARRELARPLPAPTTRRGDSPLGFDPFKDAGMRLTYRTMRVLNEISQHPRSSNKQIGMLAGATDQGQVSKLLARLQRLGVIENQGGQPGSGMPNAWMLTAAGRQVANSFHTHGCPSLFEEGM